MQTVSQNYKNDIKKKLRNHSYMRVTVGVINQQAQRSAQVDDQSNYLYFSNFRKPFNSYAAEPYYATAEQNFSKVNGTMYFAPPVGGIVALNQGVVSKEVLGSVTILFDYEYNLQGLTIDFGEYYPTDFKIETTAETYEITGNTSGSFRFEEVILGTDYVKIIPTQMVNGNGRLRVIQFSAGVGLFFDNKDIISSTKDEFISPLSEELPSITLDLTINNRDHRFDIENNLSSVNFLENGQIVTAEYGYELDNGTIFWMDGATLSLDEWDADDTEMSFTAIDKYATMNDTFYRGKFRPEGMTLYDLAEEVILDAGVDTRDYELDEYLKSVVVYNPLPMVSHAEALQLIANAGRCILYQNRKGQIYIKSSLSARRLPEMVATSNTEHQFSQVNNILSGGSKYHYAIGNKNFSTVNASMYFLPGNQSLLRTGFISKYAANESGAFSENPRIRIELEASYKSYGLRIQFAGNPPAKIKFYSYFSDDLLEEYEENVGVLDFSTDHEFPEFDRIDIEITEGYPNNNALIDFVAFGEVTDYSLTYGTELSKVPKGTLTSTTKNLRQYITTYSESQEAIKELYKGNMDVTGLESVIVTVSNASYSYSATVGGESASIVDSGAYFVEIKIPTGKTGACEIIVNGKEYLVSQRTYNYSINRDGSTVDFENPLISYEELAIEVTKWEGDYYYANKEYDIEYRGDPRIDANDIVFLENKVVSNMLVRIFEHTIGFSGGALSGSITARRDMYVDGTENQLGSHRLF